MNMRELEIKVVEEVMAAEHGLKSTLRCIRNSAQTLLERLEKGERLQSEEIDFEFTSKVHSAFMYAQKMQIMFELFKDVED